MTKKKSTKSGEFRTPKNSPFSVHKTSGQLRKKRKGKTYYFGHVDDHAAALKKYKLEWPFIMSGLPLPGADDDAGATITIKELANRFLDASHRRVDSKQLTAASLSAHIRVAKLIAGCFKSSTHVDTLTPSDFARLRDYLSKGKTGEPLALKTLEGRIAVAVALFNFGFKNGLFEKTPARMFGTEFTKPNKLALKTAKKATPAKTMTAAEILAMKKLACVQLQAMILLGINCGFGNTDCGQLQIEDIGADGFVELSRSKTGVDRRCPLWPETLAALAVVIGRRRQGFVFKTRTGSSWEPRDVKTKNGNMAHVDPISQAFAKLRNKVITSSTARKGRGFYCLRHMTQTIGGNARDTDAVRDIMGHSDASMSDTYREFIPDDRLSAVVAHIRSWLFDSLKS